MSSLTANAAQRSFRIKLVLLFLAFAAPVIFAYLAYYVWPPQSLINYGELIKPTESPDPMLRDAEGKEFPLSKLRGKWVMLTVDQAECDATCEKKLWLLRQVRLATGKNMDRVERVLLLRGQGSVTEHIRKQHPGLRVLTGADAGLLGSFPANGNLLDHIYIVDPLGNVMMRYPKTPDPSGILKDINRLMYVSQVG